MTEDQLISINQLNNRLLALKALQEHLHKTSKLSIVLSDVSTDGENSIIKIEIPYDISLDIERIFRDSVTTFYIEQQTAFDSIKVSL